jgi:hypothetical protein
MKRPPDETACRIEQLASPRCSPSVKSPIHRYRANAEHLLIMAERAATAELRAEYKQLAEGWLKMAGEAEELAALRDRLQGGD